MVLGGAILAGCGRSEQSRIDFKMGESVPNPPLTYTVIDTAWQTQLGQGFKVRVPQNRFLLITLSVTNGSAHDALLPLYSIEDGTGKTYMELESGEGVDNWFGILRNLAPAQTNQGVLLFDVPLSSYRMKLPNGGPAGEERYVTVEIPLRIDSESTVQTPLPGSVFK